MKKKDLFEQNTVLYNRLQTVNNELQKYKQLYNQNIEMINSLNRQIDELNNKIAEMETAAIILPAESEPVINIIEESAEAPKVIEVELESVTEYAAQIIGKIVLEGTKINNSVAEAQSNLSVDIINLILGKTEVCKSKIYDICHSKADDENKKRMIDSIFDECVDYFNSLKNQI